MTAYTDKTVHLTDQAAAHLTAPSADQLAAPRTWRSRATGAALVVATLAAVSAAIVHRRPMIENALASSGVEVDPQFAGLAVSSAIAVVCLGTAAIYLIVRGLGLMIDRMLRGRGRAGAALSTRTVDVTALALNAAGLLLPGDATVRTAAALPLFALIAVPVLVWAAHVVRPVGRQQATPIDRRTQLFALAVAVASTVATGVAFGRWF